MGYNVAQPHQRHFPTIRYPPPIAASVVRAAACPLIQAPAKGSGEADIARLAGEHQVAVRDRFGQHVARRRRARNRVAVGARVSTDRHPNG